MNRRVAFVDDEANIVEGIRRQLRKAFEITTFTDPVLALEQLGQGEEHAVIVSDMRMPQMSGAEFLRAVKQRFPNTIRIMLTGNQDQATAAAAVNDGAVFRFLTKPCEAAAITDVIEQAIRQYQLVTAERELLDRTLQGSIQLLVGALSIAKPELFGRCDRIERHASRLAEGCAGIDAWEISAAARLALIGCVGMADDSWEKLLAGEAVSARERDEFARHPAVGAELLRKIPRLDGVADVVLYQNKNYDGSGFPRDSKARHDIPIGARVLRIVQGYDALLTGGLSDALALTKLQGQAGCFDPTLLARFVATREAEKPTIVRVTPPELREGQTIEEDVVSKKGVLIVCRGHVISTSVARHLENLHLLNLLPETLLVSN